MNPNTDFNRTDAQLEAFFIASLVGAGRPEKTMSREVEGLLAVLARERDRPLTPFALVNFHTQDDIASALKRIGVGCYKQKSEAVCRTAGLWVAGLLDLRTVTVDQLEQVLWIGPRTARYFLLHSRAGARVAILDDQVLKHLRERGVAVPLTPPGRGPTYLRLERAFLKLADENGLSPLEYDLAARNRISEEKS